MSALDQQLAVDSTEVVRFPGTGYVGRMAQISCCWAQALVLSLCPPCFSPLFKPTFLLWFPNPGFPGHLAVSAGRRVTQGPVKAGAAAWSEVPVARLVPDIPRFGVGQSTEGQTLQTGFCPLEGALGSPRSLILHSAHQGSSVGTCLPQRPGTQGPGFPHWIRNHGAWIPESSPHQGEEKQGGVARLDRLL